MAGRPTKLTPETQDKIVTALRAGNYFDASCQYAGITERTGYNWLEKGRGATTGQWQANQLRLTKRELMRVLFDRATARQRNKQAEHKKLLEKQEDLRWEEWRRNQNRVK